MIDESIDNQPVAAYQDADDNDNDNSYLDASAVEPTPAQQELPSSSNQKQSARHDSEVESQQQPPPSRQPKNGKHTEASMYSPLDNHQKQEAEIESPRSSQKQSEQKNKKSQNDSDCDSDKVFGEQNGYIAGQLASGEAKKPMQQETSGYQPSAMTAGRKPVKEDAGGYQPSIGSRPPMSNRLNSLSSRAKNESSHSIMNQNANQTAQSKGVKESINSQSHQRHLQESRKTTQQQAMDELDQLQDLASQKSYKPLETEKSQPAPVASSKRRDSVKQLSQQNDDLLSMRSKNESKPPASKQYKQPFDLEEMQNMLSSGQNQIRASQHTNKDYQSKTSGRNDNLASARIQNTNDDLSDLPSYQPSARANNNQARPKNQQKFVPTASLDDLEDL